MTIDLSNPSVFFEVCTISNKPESYRDYARSAGAVGTFADRHAGQRLANCKLITTSPLDAGFFIHGMQLASLPKADVILTGTSVGASLLPVSSEIHV